MVAQQKEAGWIFQKCSVFPLSYSVLYCCAANSRCRLLQPLIYVTDSTARLFCRCNSFSYQHFCSTNPDNILTIIEGTLMRIHKNNNWQTNLVMTVPQNVNIWARQDRQLPSPHTEHTSLLFVPRWGFLRVDLCWSVGYHFRDDHDS